jgi:signal transduction histidine kinase
MKSLGGMLQIGLALTLIVLMGVIWFIGNNAVRSMTEGIVASRLEHDAEGLLAAMQIGAGDQPVQWRRISPVYSRPLSGHYYVIRFNNGDTVRSRSMWDQSLEIPQLAPGDTKQQLVSGPSNQQLLLLLNGYRKNGRSFTLGVAEDMTPVFQQRDYYMRWFALFALGGLIALLLVQGLVVRRSFMRLDKVREDIHRLEQGKTEKLSEDVPSEVLPLVQEFNHLLQLLSQRLERSRNGLGNLAHALKAPLNLLTQYLDSDVSNVDTQQAAVQTERIRQLMERELKRARLAGKNLSSRRFNPADDLSDLISVVQQVHQDKRVAIEHRIDEHPAPFGDREDMLELLGNLLDNAGKWAASKVLCVIHADDDICISVEDDGTGLEDADIHNLTQRGTRLDENVEGYGLGLAIVGDIVKLYGGSISFSRSEELGGLRVQVVLPGACSC